MTISLRRTRIGLSEACRIGFYGLFAAKPTVLTRSAPLPVPTLEKFPVAVIRGTKVSEQTFVRDRGNSWAEQPGLKQ